MRKLDRNVAAVLVAIGILLVFCLGLYLGSKVETGLQDLRQRKVAIEEVR